jgi:hypothetical protein
MSDRVRELAERQRQLQERCDAQRASIAREVATIEARFTTVDRTVGLARKVLLHPAAIMTGVLVLLTLGRVGGIRLLGRALVLGAATKRLVTAARTFYTPAAGRRR